MNKDKCSNDLLSQTMGKGKPAGHPTQDLGNRAAISAYGIAVANGFRGTVKEWLDSLVGPRGERGEAFAYDMFTPEQLAALAGPQGPAGSDGADGHDGQDGAPGQDGQDGAPGADGVSPVVVITEISGGHRVTVVDAEHPAGQSFNVMDGNGGNDGVSPTLRAVRSGKTVTIYYTDKNHPGNNEVLAVLYDGEDGTGSGDMRALIYDPTNKTQDIFAYVDTAVNDKQNIINLNGLLKAIGNGGVAVAQAGVDYQAPLVAGTDYQTPLTEGEDYQTPLEAGTDYQTPLAPEKLAYYGVCSTAAATQAKVVSIAGITALVSGLSIKVKFTNAQTYNGTPTLNLNSLGAKSIMRNGTTGAARYQWQAGEVLDLVYDGTNWIISEAAHATATYYGLVKLSSAFNSESETEAATPKAVKLVYDGAEAAWNLANAAIPGNQKGAADGVATLDAYGKITPAQATARMVTITSNTTLSAAHNGCRILAVGTITVTIPSTLAAGMEVEVYNYGTGVVTIQAASGVSLNGTAADSRTLDNKYDVASLAALTATDWSIHKGDAA